MRSWWSRLRSAWDWCAPGVFALAVAGLVVLVLTGECDRRERAVYLAGFRACAASSPQPVRWGVCGRDGRTFPCAKTAAGELIEVWMP